MLSSPNRQLPEFATNLFSLCRPRVSSGFQTRRRRPAGFLCLCHYCVLPFHFRLIFGILENVFHTRPKFSYAACRAAASLKVVRCFPLFLIGTCHSRFITDLLADAPIDAREETWPLDKPFRISRGSRTKHKSLSYRKRWATHRTRRRCPDQTLQPNSRRCPRRNQSIKSAPNLNRDHLQKLLPPGAARNAVDCALWDLKAKISGKRAWELANISVAPEAQTTFTISLDTPEAMATAAEAVANLPILKLKLGGDHADVTRVEAFASRAQNAPAGRC